MTEVDFLYSTQVARITQVFLLLTRVFVYLPLLVG